MTLTKNTIVPQAENTHPNDPHHVGSGSADSPGGANSAPVTQEELSQGQESYPGSRPEQSLDAQNAIPGGVAGATPTAGDTDPGSTASAEETGQDGNTNDPAKKKAHDWNG